jgi:hypothetical protein
MVEIFKTNIESEHTAVEILNSLQYVFPNYKMNVDLEDCDKILRVESTDIDVEAIRYHLVELNVDSLLIN